MKTIGHVFKGVVTLLIMTLNTIVLTMVLCLLALGKLLVRSDAALNRLRQVLAGLAESWISINIHTFALMRLTEWDIEIPDGLSVDGCYLVFSNHQSWIDIVVLQRAFNGHLPFFRFFLKSSLIWVPFLGVAWWALDMPFMKRHSREKINRMPGLKGKDLENARIACEKFREIPVSMMTFPEGTRFSVEKRDSNDSPFQNLLKPRIGGMGQVLYALAEPLDAMMDVTILYPRENMNGPAPTFWQFVSGQVPRIVVRARQLEIPPDLLGRNFRTDRAFRDELEGWVSQVWAEKDQLISALNDSIKP
jgi:1-acyl-sn-glycerol-3-phosphate acyltransferase